MRLCRVVRRRDGDVVGCSARTATRALASCRFLEPIARNAPTAQARYTAFLQAFEQLGWTEGRNVQIVARWSDGNNVEARKHDEELVALTPDVILAGGGPERTLGRSFLGLITSPLFPVAPLEGARLQTLMRRFLQGLNASARVH